MYSFVIKVELHVAVDKPVRNIYIFSQITNLKKVVKNFEIEAE